MENINGKEYRDILLKEYSEKIKNENLKIRLDIILVGDDNASKVYVNNKLKYCTEVGIEAVLHSLPETTSEKEIKRLINDLNENKDVTGIILQSPVPNHINFDECANLIFDKKDIDGFTKENVFSIYSNDEKLVPCTVKGIIKLIKYYNINLDGANVCVLGRSAIVGKPLALCLLNENATVTICHSHTKNLKEITKQSDIIISAIGKPKFVTEEMVKNDAVIVDVGINWSDGKMCGDVDYDAVSKKASLITPVPGGVGPMTIAMIIENLIIADTLQKKEK